MVLQLKKMRAMQLKMLVVLEYFMTNKKLYTNSLVAFSERIRIELGNPLDGLNGCGALKWCQEQIKVHCQY